MKHYVFSFFLCMGIVLISCAGAADEVSQTETENPAVSALPVKSVAANEFFNNFNKNVLTPFSTCWAELPNQAVIEKGYLEMRYVYDDGKGGGLAYNPTRRQLKGTEICTDFETFTEGWYGFKIFLPSAGFSKNLSETIIAQIFQAGACNSWAGHLIIRGENLYMTHRSSCSSTGYPDVNIAKLEWDKWIPIIVHFKASGIQTGVVEVWVNNTDSTKPTYQAKNINFGFGVWDNSETLAAGNGLGSKIGLYTSEAANKTIRYDNLSLLEGNPANAFSTVNPTIDYK